MTRFWPKRTEEGAAGEAFLPYKKSLMGRNIFPLELATIVFPFNAWDPDSHFATMGGRDRLKYPANTLKRTEQKDGGDLGPQ